MKVVAKCLKNCKGRIPWNKGKKGLQTAWNKGKKGSTPNWLGRKHTDESRRRMSEAAKGQTPWNKGKKLFIPMKPDRRFLNRKKLLNVGMPARFSFPYPPKWI